MSGGVGRVMIAALAGSLAAACRAPAERDPSPRIDALFAEWNRSDSPGCGVGVSRNGRGILERGYGMARLDPGVPITAGTLFDVASIAKPVTALSVMILADQGKLALDAPIWTYVPEWTYRGHLVTIRHLLGHTAGLRDVFLLTELVPPMPEGAEINAHLQAILARQRGLNFVPGSEFAYNNGGYNLLAAVVARVSGMPFQDFVHENVFAPLGMDHSTFRRAPVVVPSNQALGYHRDDRGVGLAREGGADTSAIVGNSGLSTTVGDLLRWMHNFDEPRVGTRANLTAMQAPVALPGGASPWGLGLEVGEDRGWRTAGHGGGDRGIAAYLVHYPEREVAVAVLCNLDNLGLRAGVLARQVAHLYLPDRSGSEEPPPTAPPPVELPAAELERKAGLYRDPATDTFGRVFVRNGRLMASPDAGDGLGDSVELTPIGDNRFVVAGTPIALEFDLGVRPRHIRVTGVGPVPLISERVETGATPTRAALMRLTGRYANADLGVTYELSLSAEGLFLAIPERPPIPLAPMFADAFHGALVDLIRFSRDDRRRVTGFTINRGTVRNLRFERVR